MTNNETVAVAIDCTHRPVDLTITQHGQIGQFAVSGTYRMHRILQGLPDHRGYSRSFFTNILFVLFQTFFVMLHGYSPDELTFCD